MTLATLNAAPDAFAREALARCCGSSAWVERLLGSRPFADLVAVHAAADAAFATLSDGDWREAFEHHPRIGDLDALRQRYAATAAWAGAEQSSASTADEATLSALAEGNREYEARFAHRFIVSASGRSAVEMLANLRARLASDPRSELGVAASEAARIAHLRIDKLLEGNT